MYDNCNNTSTWFPYAVAAMLLTMPLGAQIICDDSVPVTVDSRTYGYQDIHYFLTQADGPWGSLAWSYDKASNRLKQFECFPCGMRFWSPEDEREVQDALDAQRAASGHRGG